MTSHEIRPKQLRTLLLLLVLVPLIPAALMVRFMLDTLKAERLTAMDRLQQLHGESLLASLRHAPPSSEPTDSGKAEDLLRHLRRIGSDGVDAQITDARGRFLAGAPAPWGPPLAEAALPSVPGATIYLHLAGPHVLDEAIADQRRILIWIGVLTILSVVTIAGLSAIALHRQITLKDLRNTSVATVAHELRTPLASMRMLVDTLRAGRYRGETQLREYLDLMASENERLSRLAETFLTFSRLDQRSQPLQISSVAPAEIAERAVAPLRPRLTAEGCSFTLEVAPSLPTIQADPDALAQVLTNLLDNALKYTEGDKQVALRAYQEDSSVVFAVSDNGIGIPEDERSTIFEPFYQVDQKLTRSREGCGLGLAIVRRIVESHRGQIDVTSQPGKGSTFTVKIPVA